MNINIAVVGATGLVGSKMIEMIEELELEFNELYLFASKRSKGKEVKVYNKSYFVNELKYDSFDNISIDIALFAAGSEISKKYIPILRNNGVIVIDNSSEYRMNHDVPLIIPEVNDHHIMSHSNLIANPNCSTIQSVIPLKAIRDKYGLTRVNYTTYQAVSGSGVKGITDLKETLKGKDAKFYPYKIANNCIPHIDIFYENGYTKEEEKMIFETRKILSMPNLPVTATCVRVPVLNCHSVSISIQTEISATPEEIRQTLGDQEGIIILDKPLKNIYPVTTIANDKNEVYIGRIRKDNSIHNGIHLWCVADNVRKGAATNAVQIAKILIERMS